MFCKMFVFKNLLILNRIENTSYFLFIIIVHVQVVIIIKWNNTWVVMDALVEQ